MAYKKKNITILFIPNILSDEGRIVKSFPYNRSWTIRRYLKKSGFDFKDMRIEVNGKERLNLRQHLIIGDHIVIVPNVEFSVIAAWWAGATFWQGVALVAAVIGTGYSIYQAIAAQQVKAPMFNTSGQGLDADSPSSSWDGVRTTASVGTPRPIIYGTRVMGGNILNEYVSTDGDKTFLHSLVGIGEGEVDSITLRRINRNPSANFSGYTLETRLGTLNQAVISDFHDNHSLKIGPTSPLTKNSAYTYTTEDTDIEAFEIHFQLPSGLWQQDGSGSILSYDATYRVEYKLHSEETWTDLGTTTISARSRSTLKRIFRKAGLTSGQYDIRITKTSDDSDFTHTSDLYIERIDEISCEDQQIYPNVALAAVKSLAMDQLSGTFPDYEFLIRGRKIMIPKIMNGETDVPWDDYYWDPAASCYKLLADGTALTWDGETFITAYSANPIWCLYDLMTFKRAGLGNFITSSDHNLDYLVEMSQFCEERVPDGKGGWEKRFRLDVCIDSPQKALDLIMQLCTIFRALPFYSDKGQIKIAIEKPDIPVQLFGMGNIVRNSFSENWGSLREVPVIVNVQFDDEDNNYQTTTIQAAVDDEAIAAGRPINIVTIRYYGTKMSYALRYGRDYLKARKYITNTIKFKGGIGAIVRQCGELIDVAHDVPQWGFSGRVKADFDYKGNYDADVSYIAGEAVTYTDNEYKCILASTGNLPTDPTHWEIISRTKVKLDREVTIESGKSYVIRVDFRKGAYEEGIVTDLPGVYTEVNVSEAFSKTPLDFDSYSFGEVDKVVKPARIVSLKRRRNCELEIEAIEYDERIYDDSAIILPQRKYSSLSTDMPDVVNLKLTERLVRMADGTIENAIDVWFDKPNMASYMVGSFLKAKIYLSDNAGLSWSYVGETTGIHSPVIGNLKDLQSYKVAVTSVGISGEKSIDASPQDSITLLGDTVLPADVATFLVNQSRDKLTMSWPSVNDVRVLDYEIRYGESWESGQIIATKRDTTHTEYNFRIGANQKFFIKAKTRSGRYSANATEAVITIDEIPFTNIIQSYQEQTAWSGTKVNLSKVGNNLEIDAGQLSGTYTTPVRDLDYVAVVKIGTEAVVVDASSQRKWNDSPTAKWNDSPTARWSGEELSGAITFEITTSEDNVTWSDWRQWQAGDYKCRYYQLRMTLTRINSNKTIQCSQFNHYADLPDVDDKFDDEVTDAASGKDIVFTKTFHESPAIHITPNGGNAVYYKLEGIDLVGCNVKLLDIAGGLVAAPFAVHAHGI